MSSIENAILQFLLKKCNLNMSATVVDSFSFNYDTYFWKNTEICGKECSRKIQWSEWATSTR